MTNEIIAKISEVTNQDDPLLRRVHDNITLALNGLKTIQEGLDDLSGVPVKLESIGENTKAIMSDLIISRKETTDSANRLADALIKHENRKAVGMFLIVFICLAGFFGRGLFINESGVSFPQVQEKPN